MAATTLAQGVPSTGPKSITDSASDLVGLWAAQRDFGPQVRGTVEVFQEGDRWSYDVAGFASSVHVSGDSLTFEIPGKLGEFRASVHDGGRTIIGHWIQPPTVANGVRFATPVRLEARDSGYWVGELAPLRDTMTLYLSVRHANDGSVVAYIRNPEANVGTWFGELHVATDGREVRFIEPETARVRVSGTYHDDYEVITAFIPDAGGTFDFQREGEATPSRFFPRSRAEGSYAYRAPSQRKDGWETASLEEVGMAKAPIEAMVRMIIDTPMESIEDPYIHAVLVARHGKLVLEEYFHGFTREMPHDTRSASKTVTSTLIGLAIHGGEDLAVSSAVYPIMHGSANAAGNLDSRKSRLTLEHLLTMTPGLACDDNDPDSPGAEWQMQSQMEQPDWYRFTLDLPMVHEPGEHVAYCSASSNLAGGVLGRASDSWLPDLFSEYFAEPLQIESYHMNLMPTGDAYGGGGLYITGRDFLKMSQLFLDNGQYKGARILSEEWVKEAISPKQRMFGQGYGYAWWIIELPFRNRTVTAFYAGGNGGQYTMGIPELDMSIVFFGGNYGQAVTHLVKREHIPKYVLESVDSGDPGSQGSR
jgi:CubicO group peptidase (beta-lactamase class C family)